MDYWGKRKKLSITIAVIITLMYKISPGIPEKNQYFSVKI
jgi:hypothetical protein